MIPHSPQRDWRIVLELFEQRFSMCCIKAFLAFMPSLQRSISIRHIAHSDCLPDGMPTARNSRWAECARRDRGVSGLISEGLRCLPEHRQRSGNPPDIRYAGIYGIETPKLGCLPPFCGVRRGTSLGNLSSHWLCDCNQSLELDSQSIERLSQRGNIDAAPPKPVKNQLDFHTQHCQ